MTDDPLNAFTALNRVSIRAVLAHDGEDATRALARAGIIDPVSIPVLADEDGNAAGNWMGDGITPNLTGVLEPDEEHSGETGDAAPGSDGVTAQAGPRAARQQTAMLPAQDGMQPFAPVRKHDS